MKENTEKFRNFQDLTLKVMSVNQISTDLDRKPSRTMVKLHTVSLRFSVIYFKLCEYNYEKLSWSSFMISC